MTCELMRRIAFSVAVGQSTQPGGAAVRAETVYEAVFWAGIIVLVFLAGSYAIVRFSRRFRQFLLRRTEPPTHSEDVWSQHRVPPTLEDEEP